MGSLLPCFSLSGSLLVVVQSFLIALSVKGLYSSQSFESLRRLLESIGMLPGLNALLAKFENSSLVTFFPGYPLEFRIHLVCFIELAFYRQLEQLLNSHLGFRID